MPFLNLKKPFLYILDTADLRQYLSFPPRGSAVEVMRDAVETHVLGAVWLLELVLSVRVNRKTRRQLRDVADAFASPRPPRWFGVLQTQLWNQYRLLLIQGHFIEKNDVKKLIIIYMFLKEIFYISRRFGVLCFFSSHYNHDLEYSSVKSFYSVF